MNLANNQKSLNILNGHHRIKKGTFTLRLTSMIDMFTILLVFLLKSYSSGGQIVTVTEDLRLPESTSQTPPQVSSVISITRDWLLVDGRPVEKLEKVLSNNDLVIGSLNDELLKLRAITEGIGEIGSQMKGFRGNIAIQGDRDITFDLLKRVMLTCGQVGYNNLLLTVVQKE